MNAGRSALAAGIIVLWLGGCTAPPPPPPPPAPPGDPCRALQDSLNAAVPPGQSLDDLQARGIRVRTPLAFPPGAVPRPTQSSGAVVQLLISPDGTVVPGSPKTVKSVGEPQLASAMEAGALSMAFDVDGPARPAAPIPFTTTFAVCVRS